MWQGNVNGPFVYLHEGVCVSGPLLALHRDYGGSKPHSRKVKPTASFTFSFNTFLRLL